MNKILSRLFVFFFFLGAFSLAITAPARAEINYDSYPPPNFSSCSLDRFGGDTWSDGLNGNNCTGGYVSNAAACSGTYPDQEPCGSGIRSCNISCIPSVAPDDRIARGDSCAAQPNNCVVGSTCIDNICQYSGTVTEGNRCFSSTECARGTGDNPDEVMTCEGSPGVCTQSPGCETDAQCVTRTGNATAQCIALNCIVPVEAVLGTPLPDFEYCAQVPATQKEACETCMGGEKIGPEESGKIYTAVGCLATGEQELAADLIRLLLGIAGGVALLSILAGGFIFTTSQGESNRVKEAKELITAAVTGLLFIIFVVIILDFIGVKILQIPGLG